MRNILLITNNSEISSFVKLGLEENNCSVVVAYDINFGEKIILEKKFDVIMLDVGLAEINHYELCKKIRNHDTKTPILMLMESAPIEAKGDCYDFIVDDYILKPISLTELVFRINVLSQRKKETGINTSLKFSNLEVDPISKTVKRNNKEIKLTAREYKILELLLLNKGRVLNRNEIAEKVWGFNFKPGINVINVNVNTLRNKIDRAYSPKLIHTLIGHGYILKADEYANS